MADANLTINTSAIKGIQDAARAALVLTTDALYSDIIDRAIVPKDTGALEESMESRIGDDGRTALIIWTTPYARRVYFHPEFNFRTDRNRNARGRWMDDYQYGENAEWLIQTYGEFLKREVSRR